VVEIVNNIYRMEKNEELITFIYIFGEQVTYKWKDLEKYMEYDISRIKKILEFYDHSGSGIINRSEFNSFNELIKIDDK